MGSPQHIVGTWLVVGGVVLVIVGALIWAGGLAWFGQLPGDFRVERESFKLYAPITSMLLVSAALTLVVRVVRRLL